MAKKSILSNRLSDYMEEDQGDTWIMPNGIYLGFRACRKAPIICMVCLQIPDKSPLEFRDLDEFARHLVREHRFYFWKPKFYI